ncbi:DUF547 domain-containing protein [Spirochaeta dissipatitropha]
MRSVSFIIVLFLSQILQIAAAPQAEPWPLWEEHNPESTTRLDHGLWADFLESYLITDHNSGVHRLPYAEVSQADLHALKEYISYLSEVRVSDLNRDEQMAFWTNLYNAVTVDLILEYYPVQSIRDIKISGPVFNRHPWDAHLVRIEGVDLSLNDIEHRIMRPIWQDPRIHYAVNCASIGCPNLFPEPFTGEHWNQQYDQAAREFIHHPRAVSFRNGVPELSSIFTWYEDDFGGNSAGVISHLLEYAEGNLKDELQAYADGGYRGRIRYSYDWNLNEP